MYVIIFLKTDVLKGANVNQANLNLNKPLIRNQIADIVFSLIGALIGDLITEGIKYMAGVPPFGGPHAVCWCSCFIYLLNFCITSENKLLKI